MNESKRDNLRCIVPCVVSGILRAAILLVALLLILSVTALPRTLLDPDRSPVEKVNSATGTPIYCLAAHRVGKIELAVANNGTIGNQYYQGEQTDWFTGQPIMQSCQYPKGSNVAYMFGGAFWIGAVVGRDTLVSVGADGWQWVYEMYPDEAPFGEMIYRSIRDPSKPEYQDAVSEEDFIS
ncbi:MAG: hypothetical protein DRP47_08865, partial [Candidatus Zixiibacteriota bacterium]